MRNSGKNFLKNMSLGGSRGSVMLVRGLCASRHRAAMGLLGGLPLGVSRGRVVGRSSSAQRGAGGLSGVVFSVGSEGVTRRLSRTHGFLPRRRSNRCCPCRPVDYLPGWLWSRFDPGGDLRPGGACGDHSASGGQFPRSHPETHQRILGRHQENRGKTNVKRMHFLPEISKHVPASLAT